MFRIFRNVRVALAALVLIPMGLFMGYTAAFGSGHAVVVAPEDGPVSVSIDGAAPKVVAAGAHQQFELKQGAHTLKLDGAGGAVERKVDVKSGFATLLVPANDHQCFVVLDVSKSHYNFGNKPAAKAPTVKTRVASHDIYDLPGSTYYSEEELPSSIKENSSANLLIEGPCELLSGSTSDVLKTLGY